MGPFEMVVWIVVICTVGSIIGKYLHSRHGKSDRESGPDWSDCGWGTGHPGYSRKELKPYLEKIDALEERIRVLERIVTDKGSRLSREIDELR